MQTEALLPAEFVRMRPADCRRSRLEYMPLNFANYYFFKFGTFFKLNDHEQWPENSVFSDRTVIQPGG